MIHTMSKKIVFICWVSWSGKTTIVNALLKTNKFKYFPSYVTRDPRPWENNWERYHFISNEEFKKSLKNGEFLEYNLVHHQNKYYWTKNDIVEWLKWKRIHIKEVDMVWLEKIIKSWKIKNNFLNIFLDIADKTMIKRIHKRWKPISDEELKKRLVSAKEERILAKKYSNYILDVDWVLDTDTDTEKENINKVLEILKKEKIL
jgi:guanylate kinase